MNDDVLFGAIPSDVEIIEITFLFIDGRLADGKLIDGSVSVGKAFVAERTVWAVAADGFAKDRPEVHRRRTVSA